MFDFLTHLFDTTGFPPRWRCGAWTPEHGWLHILSDLGVWSAYVAIPCVLGYFVLRRRDIPFRNIFWLFGAFILACGTTHLMEAIIFWWPAYRLAGVIKLFTALVSWGTVLALIPVTPKALAMRSPEELEREIAARKEAEAALQRANAELGRQVEALRASEERFRLLVDGTRDYAIFLLDPAGRVVSWNPGAERINQYRAEEIIGQPLSRFYPAERVRDGAPQRELRVAAAEGHYEEEDWRVRKDGSRFWANVIITALREQDGTLRGFSKITRDMTERKQAEENARRLLEEAAARRAAEAHAAALWEERERLRVTLHSIGDGVITTDADGRVTLLNPVAEALTGWRPEEATGRTVAAVFPLFDERTREEVENPVVRALRQGQTVGLINHTLLVGRDGRERPIDDSAAPIKNEQGQTVGAVLVFRDVTERRAADNARRASEERLSLALDAAELGLWDWDVRSDEVVWNRHHEKMFGYTPGRPKRTYRDFADRVPPEELAGIEAGFRRAMEERRDYRFEHRVVWPDGTTRWVASFGRFYYDAAGRPARSVGVLLDVTERKRSEAALREADRRKDEFLATLAHELRNPLAPIRNAVHVMHLRPLDDPQLRSARDVIARQAGQLTRLVDDLLDLSRISRGKVELRKEVVDLADVVKGAVETTRPLVEERRHELTVSLPDGPVRLEADPTRLEQILANLLNNSAKYTEPGGRVWLTARRDGDAVVVAVRDTGVGIRPELLPRLFEMFVQADHAGEHAQGGLGIGLALVRSLVEMHGGSVTAHSDGPGKGSEFRVRLPALAAARQDAAAPPVAAPAAAPPARRVLVVDDNVDAADSLVLLLRLEGHEARAAHDGRAALEAVRADAPDIVFLDIGLPDLSGYEVARQLRQTPEGERIVLVALTGWGQEEDRRRSREAGFDHHFVKPVDSAALHGLLAGNHAR